MSNPGSTSAGSSGGQSDLLKFGLLGGAGFAAYQFLYVPYAAKKAMEEATRAALAANLARGMSLKDAAADAIAGACGVAAAAYAVPPSISGGVCKGIGLLAVKGAIVAGKGAVLAGKAVGKAGAVVGKGVAKGATVVGKGVGKSAVVVGKGAALVGKSVGGTVKLASYTAPKAVVKGALKVVGIGGSSKLGRAANGKDVFPNDLANCKRVYGITDWRACGAKYDTKAKRWPAEMTSLAPLTAALADADADAVSRPNPLLVHSLSGLPRRPRAAGTSAAGKRLARERSERAAVALGTLANATRPRVKPRRGSQVSTEQNGSAFYGRHL